MDASKSHRVKLEVAEAEKASVRGTQERIKKFGFSIKDRRAESPIMYQLDSAAELEGVIGKEWAKGQAKGRDIVQVNALIRGRKFVKSLMGSNKVAGEPQLMIEIAMEDIKARLGELDVKATKAAGTKFEPRNAAKERDALPNYHARARLQDGTYGGFIVPPPPKAGQLGIKGSLDVLSNKDTEADGFVMV